MRGASVYLTVALLAALPAAAAETITYDAEQQALDFMALSYASGKGHLVLVQGLIKRGAPVNPPPFSGATGAQYLAAQFQTPLQAAAEAGHLDIISLLLGSSADPNWQCCSGETALYFAAANGHRAAVEALLSAGADPNLGTGSGSPLAAAQKGGYSEIVSILVTATGKPE